MKSKEKKAAFNWKLESFLKYQIILENLLSYKPLFWADFNICIV